MEGIDHLDLVVSDLGRSLRFYLEIVHWPREEDLAARVAELEERLTRLEGGGPA